MAEPDDRKIGSVFVPSWACNLRAYAAKVAKLPAEELCLHEDPKAKGTWVCVLPAEHDGRHG